MKSVDAAGIARLLRVAAEFPNVETWPARQATEGHPGLPASSRRPVLSSAPEPAAAVSAFEQASAAPESAAVTPAPEAVEEPSARDDWKAAKSRRARVRTILAILVLFLLGTWAGATLVPRLVHRDAYLPPEAEPRTVRPDISLEGMGRSAQLAPDDAAIGRALGRVLIPRLGIAADVREGIDGVALSLAIAHVPGTALPGERGNVALAGLADTFFRDLPKIRPDDRIAIATSAGCFIYRVRSVRVMAPEEIAPWSGSDAHTLTLVTCCTFGSIRTTPQRFVVIALQECFAPHPGAPDASAGTTLLRCAGRPGARTALPRSC